MCDHCEPQPFDHQNLSMDDVVLTTAIGMCDFPAAAQIVAAPATPPVTLLTFQGEIHGPTVREPNAAVFTIVPLDGLANLAAQIGWIVSTWPADKQARYTAQFDQQVCRVREAHGK